MTLPVRTPLGGSTLNRKWYLDVSEDDGTTWVPVMGLTEFQPGTEATLQDDSDFDSEGFRSSTKTASAWSCTGTVRRGVVTGGTPTYDPGQEMIRLAADEMGVANVLTVRFYEMEDGGPRVLAYRGEVATDWTDNGGDMAANSTAGFTLTGRGRRIAITHPSPAA
ncbi:MAG TPA: hypothetical protein VD864_00125 [Nocardioides sp.]|nr:hypothetical protein [Nocardioides sp.]